MMDDLISRQGAIKAMLDNNCYRDSAGYAYMFVGDAVALLETMPPAHPEVIRCKDCLMHGVCRFEQGLGLDGYCSQAKRRTDE